MEMEDKIAFFKRFIADLHVALCEQQLTFINNCTNSHSGSIIDLF